MNTQTTIGGLFAEDGISFYVPSYQRAYSWEVGTNGTKGQIEQFLDDIKEQDPNSDYYLGHFLFEKGDEGEYFIIDGQQRLTTTVIFMSCLTKEITKRNFELTIGKNKKFPAGRIWEVFLKPHYGCQRFSTVKEDALYFNKLVIECSDDNSLTSKRRSESNIKKAVSFFSSEMSNAKEEELSNWFSVLYNAVITTFALEGKDSKVTATQIFAFQNDRGKGLTTLEKLKAFFMHKVYKLEPNNAKANIDALDSKFASIYSHVEILNTKEDTVLNYHCQAFTKGWDNAFENIKEDLSKEQDKLLWINNFVSSLSRTFEYMCDIEDAINSYNCSISDVCILDKQNSMPLIIKLCHYTDNGEKIRNNERITNALQIVEKILFKLNYTVGNYRTNYLIGIAKNYSRDSYDRLIQDLNDIELNGFKGYWNFNDDCKRYFSGHYHYKGNLRYVLYKYENYLRTIAKQPLLTPDECTNVFREKRIENTLDHITPQNPDFTEYSEEFKNEFLNDMGNLSLLTWGNNSQKNNHNPVLPEYREMYDSVFFTQKEIFKTLCDTNSWGEKEISDRHDRLFNFIIKNWNLK